MASSARLADDLAVHLRDRILAGGLSAGTQLAEQTVAAEYDVARPTVRSAIAILERDGLLHRKPHMPATVARVQPEDIPDIIKLLETTENLALMRILQEDPDLRPLRRNAQDSMYSFLDSLVELSGSERLMLIHRRSTFELLLASLASPTTISDPGSSDPAHDLLNAIFLQQGAAAHAHLSALQHARQQCFATRAVQHN
ncbi:MAG: GntR family transcriptional regulator [Ancrocorticia sp.]|uniref:GntR family transcriptional regulator n=1 Tax=Ancrocorticia sp. TaxID=2593684 RepID=UPI003F926E95